MLKSSLCDCSAAYIHVSGNIEIPNTGTAAARNNKKNIIIKNWALFDDCISGINNKEIDNVKDIDVVMPMYNLMEYSDNYSKTTGSFWQYYRDEPFLDANGNITDFPTDDYTERILETMLKLWYH